MTLKAFSYRFYPTPEQESLLRRTLGCTRLVYNRALAARTEAWYKDQKRVGYAETSSMLTEWKKTEELDFHGRSFFGTIAAVLAPFANCLQQLL